MVLLLMGQARAAGAGLAAHPGYRLCLCGHSLGAGAAALLAVLLK